MKLLIIGGSGLLSGAVVNEALKHGIEVTVVNRGQRQCNYKDGVHFIKADYRNEALMKSQLEGLYFDAVIDFICFDKLQLEYSVNLLHSYAKQYIFISTSCVYNTTISGVKDENAEKVLNGWDYSINKWECECLLEKKAKELGFNYTIIRPCITYDDSRIPYGIMPPYGYHWTLVARMLAEKPIIRWDGGTTRWNMMRVEDFAVGVVGILGNEKAYNEAFNVSGDKAYEWNDVLKVVAKEIGKEPIIVDMPSCDYQRSYPARAGEIVGRSLDSVVSNEKIKKMVPSFHQTISLEKGIRMTLNAYKMQNYQYGIDWNFDAVNDRIIRKYCKRNGIDAKNFNLHFIDYLGTATQEDRRTYWLEMNKETISVRILQIGQRCLSKIKQFLG